MSNYVLYQAWLCQSCMFSPKKNRCAFSPTRLCQGCQEFSSLSMQWSVPAVFFFQNHAINVCDVFKNNALYKTAQSKFAKYVKEREKVRPIPPYPLIIDNGRRNISCLDQFSHFWSCIAQWFRRYECLLLYQYHQSVWKELRFALNLLIMQVVGYVVIK